VTVTLTLTPADGYEPETVSAYRTGDVGATVETLRATSLQQPIQYTFTMPAYGVTVTATFKKTQAQLDRETVETAKAAIEGGTYRVAQATGNDASSIRTWLMNTLGVLFGQSHGLQLRAAGTSLDALVTITAITPAITGTEAAPAGINGSFSYTVSLSKDAANATATVASGVIVAMPHASTPVKRIELLSMNALTVRIINTGNLPTGDLTLALSGTNADVFTLPATPLGSLSAGDEVDVRLAPGTNLAIGTYTATLTVTAEGMTAVSVEIRYTVTTTGIDSPPPTGLKAWVVNGSLHVSGLTAGELLSIYNMQGQLIYKGKATATEERINLRVRGVYVVTSDNAAVKVIY
jgi:hypothetical protein